MTMEGAPENPSDYILRTVYIPRGDDRRLENIVLKKMDAEGRKRPFDDVWDETLGKAVGDYLAEATS